MPKKRNGRSVNEYLLAGHLKCASCDARVVGVVGVGKQQNIRGYRCLSTFPTVFKPASCGPSFISADYLENRVWRCVSSLMSQPALIVKSLTAHLEADSANLEEEIALLERQINCAKRREESLVQQYADGLIEGDLLLQQLSPIEEGRVRKEEGLREAERKRAVRHETLLLRARIENYARRLGEGLSVETFDGKRAALDALGAHAVVSTKGVVLKLPVPTDLLLDVDGSE